MPAHEPEEEELHQSTEQVHKESLPDTQRQSITEDNTNDERKQDDDQTKPISVQQDT